MNRRVIQVCEACGHVKREPRRYASVRKMQRSAAKSHWRMTEELDAGELDLAAYWQGCAAFEYESARRVLGVEP